MRLDLVREPQRSLLAEELLHTVDVEVERVLGGGVLRPLSCQPLARPRVLASQHLAAGALPFEQVAPPIRLPSRPQRVDPGRDEGAVGLGERPPEREDGDENGGAEEAVDHVGSEGVGAGGGRGNTEPAQPSSPMSLRILVESKP